MKRDNLSVVLELVHRTGGLSRAALTAQTGLNRSTIAGLVADLAALDLVVEGSAAPTNRVGRPSPFVSPSSHPVVVAVNPELDAITVGTVGLGGRIESRVRHRVDAAPTPDQTVDAVVEALRSPALHDRRIVAVSLAVPGLVRAGDGLVRWAPHLDWRDAPLTGLVTDATGLPAVVGNDASLGALAEHVFGAGRGVADLVYLNGGASGIGGGVIVGGQPLGGVDGYAGEFGHTRAGGDPADRITAGGALEDEVSRARLLSAVGLGSADEVELETALLASGDPAVLAELGRQRRILAVALGSAVNVLNPALVVLGGFLATVRASAADEFDALVAAASVPTAWEGVRIERTGLGPDLLMIGAAELGFARLLAAPATCSVDTP